MKSTFQEVADKLNIPLIYANLNLANIKLDELSHSDFSEEGLVIIVSPLYTSGVPYDTFGRISRPFEIGVFGILNLDFNDEDADALLTKCEKVFSSIVKTLNLRINTVNVVPLRFDVGLGGMYANIFYTNKSTCDAFDMKPTIPSNAAQITVSEPVTPDFTPAVQGNNLQQVTNKVAGLQNPNLIVDFTTPTDVIQIIIDTDRFGNPLNITTGERIIVVFEHSFVDELGNPANNRCFYRINNITSRDYRFFSTDSVSFQALTTNGYSHYTVFQLIVDGNVHGFGSNHGQLADGTFFGGGMNYFSLIQEVSSINSIWVGRMDSGSLIKAGAKFKIYKL